jgi:hypothetical protein
MTKLIKQILNPVYSSAILFIAVFLYFAFLNPYHLFYLEQTQLFRFKWDYFAEFIVRPGGFSEYCGAHLTQFFLFPFIGPVVVTFISLIIYIATIKIFKRFNVYGIIWSFIPVLMIVALHNDYLYKLGYSIGLMISLIYIAACLPVKNGKIRYAVQIGGFLILYPLTGLFSFLAPAVFILNEVFFSKNKYRFYIISGHFLMIALIPYLFWRYIYILPLPEAWLSHAPVTETSKFVMDLMLGFYPLFLIVARLLSVKLNKPQITFSWGWKNIVAGIIIVTTLSGFMKKYTYDLKTELILKIDNYIQKSDWVHALEQCTLYPEPNKVIVYFTNLALLKTGHLGDQLFKYNHVGPLGLSLQWTTNNLATFFGCEIYYQLDYNNEAYRWAFEAMEVNGQCPRLLKRLVMTSLINGDTRVAEKYLKQLQQSYFYRGWANHYLEMVNNPELLKQDKEISEKRKLLIQNDFFSGTSNSALALDKLLENHPNNKNAFEYYMAELLLRRDLVPFVEATKRLKSFGYKEIPVAYEEAILWYIGYSKQNIIPEGYGIRKSTLQRFKDYNYSYRNNTAYPNLAAKSMEKEFGNTFWYYFHFMNS